MRENIFKKLLKQDRILVGCAVGLPHAPEMIRTCAAAGFDFLWFDMEHGQVGTAVTAELSRVAVEAGITPLIRMRSDNPGLVTQMLDGGAQGVIFARIESHQQAEEAVSWVKYPPQGRRGCAMKPFHRNYQPVDANQFLKEMNRQTLVAVQIETVDGVRNIEQIVSIAGIDLILIGPFDLSVSLGEPGHYGSPAVEEAISCIIEAARAHKMPCGILGNIQLAKKWISRGMEVVSCGSIVGLFMQTAQEIVKEVRSIS